MIRTRIRRFKVVFPVALSLSIVAAGCGSTEGSNDLTEVTMALPTSNPNALFMNVVTADELGFYEEQGLSVSMEYLGSNAAVAAAVESGDAEFGIMNPMFQISQAAEGSELEYSNVFQYSYSPKWVFVAPDGSDTDAINELDDATIALVGLNSEDESVSDMWLSEAGVDTDSVDYEVIADGAPMGAALEQNQVDAAVAWDSTLGFFDVSGIPYTVLDVPDSVSEVGGFSVAAGSEVIEDNPDLVVDLGRALVQNTEFLLDDLEAGAQAYNEMYPGGAAAGDDPESAAEETATLVSHRAEAWERPEGLMWGEARPDEWQRNFELTRQMPDAPSVEGLTMEDFVDQSFLDEINETGSSAQ